MFCARKQLYFIHFNRRLFKTTLTLDSAMRAEAAIGVICQLMPKA